MKTISEIAKELSVSRQSVYRKVTKNVTGRLQGHVHKENGATTMIDDVGVQILKDLFCNNGYSKVTQSDNQSDTRGDSKIISILQEQLQKKDEQIATLMSQMENMQILLKQEQNTVKLLEEKHTPFINKLFKKKESSS
jgi:predicted transcriptional regulator